MAARINFTFSCAAHIPAVSLGPHLHPHVQQNEPKTLYGVCSSPSFKSIQVVITLAAGLVRSNNDRFWRFWFLGSFSCLAVFEYGLRFALAAKSWRLWASRFLASVAVCSRRQVIVSLCCVCVGDCERFVYDKSLRSREETGIYVRDLE